MKLGVLEKFLLFPLSPGNKATVYNKRCTPGPPVSVQSVSEPHYQCCGSKHLTTEHSIDLDPLFWFQPVLVLFPHFLQLRNHIGRTKNILIFVYVSTQMAWSQQSQEESREEIVFLVVCHSFIPHPTHFSTELVAAVEMRNVGRSRQCDFKGCGPLSPKIKVTKDE